MTRKDYERIAFIIKETLEESGDITTLINKMCNMFKFDNPRFNEDKFRRYIEP